MSLVPSPPLREPGVRSLCAKWQGGWPRALGSPSLERRHCPAGLTLPVLAQRDGNRSSHLSTLGGLPPTSAEAPAPPGPSPGHLALRTHPSTVRHSLLALCGSQHTISLRRHLLSVSPNKAAGRTNSGCGHCGSQERCPQSPALAHKNSVASGAKPCHTYLSQGA